MLLANYAIEAEERAVFESLRRHNSCVDFTFVRDKESYNSRKLTKLNAVFERLADRDGGGAPVEELWRLVTAVGCKEVALAKYRALLDGNSTQPPSSPWSPPRGKTGKRLLSRGQFLAIFGSERASFVDELVRKVVRDHGKPHSKKKQPSYDIRFNKPISSDEREEFPFSWTSDLDGALHRQDSCATPLLDPAHAFHRQMTFECHNFPPQDDCLRSPSDPCLVRGNNMGFTSPLLDFGDLGDVADMHSSCSASRFSPDFEAENSQQHSQCLSPRLVLDLRLCEIDDDCREGLSFLNDTFVFRDSSLSNAVIRRHTSRASTIGDNAWWDDTLSCDGSEEEAPPLDILEDSNPAIENTGVQDDFVYSAEGVKQETSCQRLQEEDYVKETPTPDHGEDTEEKCSFLRAFSLFLKRMSFRRKISVFALEAAAKN